MPKLLWDLNLTAHKELWEKCHTNELPVHSGGIVTMQRYTCCMKSCADDLDVNGIAELLYASDLSPQGRRSVHNAVASSFIEGGRIDRESLLRLIELAAGRITGNEHKRQVLASHTRPR